MRVWAMGRDVDSVMVVNEEMVGSHGRDLPIVDWFIKPQPWNLGQRMGTSAWFRLGLIALHDTRGGS